MLRQKLPGASCEVAVELDHMLLQAKMEMQVGKKRTSARDARRFYIHVVSLMCKWTLQLLSLANYAKRVLITLLSIYIIPSNSSWLSLL